MQPAYFPPPTKADYSGNFIHEDGVLTKYISDEEDESPKTVMKILDYLYYYTAQLITSMRIRKVQMERIPEQAAYSLALCSLAIISTIDTIFD